MRSPNAQAEAAAAPESSGGDRAALRRLVDRVRDHLAQSEARAETELGRLGQALADGSDLPRGALQDLAEDILAKQRGTARDLARLSGELEQMASDLDRRLARADDSRALALRALADEVAALADRIGARADEAQDRSAQALARLSERLTRWEAAAEARGQRVAEIFAEQLQESEARREVQLGEILRAPKPAEAVPPPAEPSGPADSPAAAPAPPAVSRSRSGALLLATGVACLGLVTLAVVLEPPPLLRSPAGEAGEVTLRGPIVLTPPRRAQLDDPSLPAPAQPQGQDAAAMQKAFLAAAADAEAGRPGGLARLRSLADRGVPRAQMYLAKLYEGGLAGLAQDSAEARRWTARAADAGDPVAMHNLALYYLKGRGGPRDDAMAARLLRRAAAAGVTDSQFNLAMLYETGAGVERNLVEAYRWFQIAASNGDLAARGRAVALEDRLSPKELALAERAAGRFRPGSEAAEEETVLVAGAATVAESQKKLARLGYYIGPTDGQDSPAYRAAVEAFRRDEARAPGRVAVAVPLQP